MIRWCNIPMLLAALAVAMPGCAQNRTMVRAGLPSTEIAGTEPTTRPQDDPAGVHDARSVIDSAGVPRVAQADYSKTARLGPAVTESETVVYHADEFQLNDLQIARGAEPEPAPGDEPVSGEQSKPTLQYLTRLAIDNHPLLQRDQARITSAAGQALQAGLYPNPTFDTNNPQVFNGPLGTALNVGFTQEIVVKGKLRLDRAAALRAQQQAELAYVADKYALLAQVRNQFYQTLAAQFRVEVLSRLLVVTDASVKTGEERVKATIADNQELLLLQIDDNRVKANLENATKVLDGERKQLAALVGFPDLVSDQVVGSLTAATPVFDEEAMQQFVTSENAQVQIARLEIDRNRLLLKRAEVEPAPNVIIGPAYQYGLNKTQEQFWMTVVFPIPVSNRNQGNIGSARADIRDSTESLSAVQLDLLRKMADSLSAHRGALEQAEKYKTKIIPDAREALRLAKSGYDAGVLEFAVYLQSQRTLIETTQDYVDVLETVWTTAADLSGILQMDRFP